MLYYFDSKIHTTRIEQPPLIFRVALCKKTYHVQGNTQLPTMDSSYLTKCHACGREFAGPGPLNFHIRACPQGKKRRQGALEKAKEVWMTRKKPRIYPSPEDVPSPHNTLVAMPIAMEATSSISQTVQAQAPPSQVVEPAKDAVRSFCTQHAGYKLTIGAGSTTST